MPVNQFFVKKGPFPLKEIIKNIRCNGDFSHANDFEIYGVESLSNATKNDMTFLNSSRYKNLSLETKAAACITSSNLSKFLPDNCIKLDVKNILSKEEYGKKMNSLRKRNIDYQTERRTAIDKITMHRAKARETLLEKLKRILEYYIKENSVSLVVDKKYILGGGPSYDITKVIVEKLNKDLPSLNLK